MDEVGRNVGRTALHRRGCRPPGPAGVQDRDSKQLTEPEREALFDRIAGWCSAWAVGHATVDECETLGMSAAQRLAADRALEGLGLANSPDKVLLDGNWDFVGRARRSSS